MDEEQDLQQLLSDFIETGKKYQKMHQETITTLAGKLDNLKVSLPQSEKESVASSAKIAAKQGVKDAINEAPAKVPSSSQLEPVLKAALEKIGPEAKFKRVINGKKYFWIGLVLFVCWTIGHIYDIKKERSFDGTPESWANRMYVASKEIGEKNPGAGYDEIMTAFATGNAENAKEKVVRKENKLSELKDHRGKYERMISEYLSKDYPSGVRIVEFEEDTRQRYDEGIIFKETTRAYNFVYIKAVTMDEQKELYIAMERLAMPFWARDPWDIHITEDARINSITNYRQKAGKVKWIYSEKKAVQ